MPPFGSRPTQAAKVTKVTFTILRLAKQPRASRNATNVSRCGRLIGLGRLAVWDSVVRWPRTGLMYSCFRGGGQRKIATGTSFPTPYGERSRAPGGRLFHVCPGRLLALPIYLAANCSPTDRTSARNYPKSARTLTDPLRRLPHRQRLAADQSGS